MVAMGNTACCQSEPDAPEAFDAKPILDSSGLAPAASSLTGGETEADRIYHVVLEKAEGQKLGLDVDYMAERRLLPIMHVTGGVADAWNRSNPSKKMNSGDSILEVNGIKGDVVEMLEKCKADNVLKLTLCRALTYEYLVEDLERLIRQKQCGPMLIRLSFNDAGVFNGVDGCPNAAMRLQGAAERDMEQNAGLPQGLNLLAPISTKYVPRCRSSPFESL